MRVTRVRKASKLERISQRRVRPPENEELECNCKRRDADVAISKDIRKYIVYILYGIRFSPLTEPPRSARRRSTVTVKEDWVTLMMMRIMIMRIKWEGSKKNSHGIQPPLTKPFY